MLTSLITSTLHLDMKSQEHCPLYSDNTGIVYNLHISTNSLYHEVCRYFKEEEEAQRNLYDEIDILFSRGRISLWEACQTEWS